MEGVLFGVMRHKISMFASDGIKYKSRGIRKDLHSDCTTPSIKHPVQGFQKVHFRNWLFLPFGDAPLGRGYFRGAGSQKIHI